MKKTGLIFALILMLAISSVLFFACDNGPTQYTITFNGTENAQHSNPATFTENDLNPNLTLTSANRAGYWTFLGWYDNAEFDGDAVTEITQTGNIELWARWGQWATITATQAYAMMNAEGFNAIILDVRTQLEFDYERLDGAILIPYTELADRAEAELTDKNAQIMIYCRAGRRSAIAAGTLAGLGFTRVYDFGGINVPEQWPYSGIVGDILNTDIEITVSWTIPTTTDTGQPFPSIHGFSVRLERNDGTELIPTNNPTTFTVNAGQTIRVYWHTNSTFSADVKIQSQSQSHQDIYSGITGTYAYFDLNITTADTAAPIIIEFLLGL